MTITSGTDVYADHGEAYTYNNNHGESTWTGNYKVITSIVTHADGIKITAEAHGFEVGDSVSVVETTNYNTTLPVVTVVDTNNFTIADTYVSGETSGYVGTEANVKAIEVALRKATEWIDNHPGHRGNWKGSISSTTQLLSHPRTGLYDEEGRVISSSSIATQVRDSCSIMANKVVEDSEDIFPDISAASKNLKRKKIDVIEREWFSASTSSLRKKYDYVDNLLSGLLNNVGAVKYLQRGY
jgi:hypothetical protein